MESFSGARVKESSGRVESHGLGLQLHPCTQPAWAENFQGLLCSKCGGLRIKPQNRTRNAPERVVHSGFAQLIPILGHNQRRSFQLARRSEGDHEAVLGHVGVV